ncbi:MAG TPA: type II toxin-antitoxin system PemK/MazF family toxin [Tepidisphaeraceae bacterium]|nr:type II toxin-antitoxin system PemK/MazF family toxin [Tepidisphaeraceae bacterium]
MTPIASRGEIWRVDLDPVRGHEQGRVRPALIISNNIFNHGSIDLVTVVPITSKGRPIRSWLRIDPPEGGVSQARFIICDQVRTISKDRLGKRFGTIRPATLAEVERRLRHLLDLH